MNIQEAKSLFLAQYLEQDVYYHHNWVNPLKLNKNNYDWALCDTKLFDINSTPAGGCLLLRSVNQLTDDEKISIAKLIDGHITDSYSERQLLEVAYRFIHHFLTGRNFIYSIHEMIKVLQYLLCIGILLPFVYLNEENKPITLQPNEIIKLGWAKIKE